MPTSGRIRIVIADDFPKMLEAVEHRLAPRYEIIGRVQDGVALVDCACRLKPDLLVLDWAMPKLNGIDALRGLRILKIQIPAIILTIHEDEDLAQEARSVGAQGFVIKSRLETDLPLAVAEVLAGRTFTSEPLGNTSLKKLCQGAPVG